MSALGKKGDYCMFPVDIAKTLIERFSLLDVRDLGLYKIIELSSQTTKARKALWELDRAVKANAAETLSDRTTALSNVLKEVNETVKSMVSSTEKIEKIVPVVFGAIGGIAGSLAGPQGLVTGGLAGAIGSFPFADEVASSVAKLGQANHIVAVYDLARAFPRSTSSALTM
jgi:hypothetical protein